MKRHFKSGKIWTTLPGLLFFMTCGVFITCAANSSTNNLSFTEKYSTNNINNTLTDTGWNNLMNDLDNLIPEGGVIAFADRTSCPKGWTQFTAADERFLMGATSKIGNGGGTNIITLTVDQLPPHKHNIKYRTAYNFGSHNANRAVIVDRNNENIPDRNRSFLDWEGVGRTSSVGNGNSINIQNPYVKVLYCVKGNTTVQGDSCEDGYSNINTLSCGQGYEVGLERPSTFGGFTCGKCIKSECPNGRYECDIQYEDLWIPPINIYYAGNNTCVKSSQCCYANEHDYVQDYGALVHENGYDDYSELETICR